MKKSNETGDLVAVEETELDGLQSWKDLVDDFDESVYIINEKMQVTKDYFSIMFTQLLRIFISAYLNIYGKTTCFLVKYQTRIDF